MVVSPKEEFRLSENLMRIQRRAHLLLAFTLAICLSLPSTCFAGGKEGKKNFKEGVKYETAEQWDLAAQQYALAVAAEPDNAEYRLRMLRAMQMASLMFSARGDLLESKSDYAGAYHAYALASTYDPTNETTRIKMKRMIEQQKAQAGSGAPSRYNPRTGNLVRVSDEIRTPQPQSRGDLLQQIKFKEGTSLKLVIANLAGQLNLNVIFDESFKDTNKFSFSLTDVTVAKALDLLLLQNKLIFVQLDRRTIMIYADNPANRQRLEPLLVKTFYLSNADPNETRALIQANLGSQRQVNVSKQLNALVVRATASELAVAQALIDSLDKNRSEVILDVNIYEVSNSTSLQIGNQIAPQSTENSLGLNNLGGVASYLEGKGGSPGGTKSLIGTSGALIGLPLTSLSLLQSKGNSKLLASTQVHALDGEQNQTVVGRSVPIRIGTTFLNGANTTGNNNNNTVDNIQYRDVGLVIDVTPVITNEGYVQVKMKLESSNVEASGADSTLTPSFTKRSLTTISRVQDGITAVVASVKQDNKGDSRATIPVIGMLPILGRLFSAPNQTRSQSDIVITVTPHIIRPVEITPEDHLAHLAGTQQSGLTQSIEDVIFRAQAADEQERRSIAQQPSTPPSGQIIEASDKRSQ
jgi:general secretion pathway protein D